MHIYLSYLDDFFVNLSLKADPERARRAARQLPVPRLKSCGPAAQSQETDQCLAQEETIPRFTMIYGDL